MGVTREAFEERLHLEWGQELEVWTGVLRLLGYSTFNYY